MRGCGGMFFFSIIVWLVVAQVAHGSAAVMVDSWGAEDGLPHNTVTCLKQTHDGYLWIGTHHGAARFDGVRFSLFGAHNTPELRSNRIVAFEEVTRGSESELWVGTDGGGIMRMMGGPRLSITSWEGLPDDTVEALGTDAQGRLVVVTARGSVALDGGELKPVETSPKRSDDWKNDLPDVIDHPVLCALKDADGIVWVGTEGGGLLRIRQRLLDPCVSPSEEVLSTFNLPAQFSQGHEVTAFCRDTEKRLWVGTRNHGIFLYDGTTSRHFGPDEGFPARMISTIVQDRDGDIWVGSDGMGLYQFANGRVSYYCRREGWGSEWIRSLFVDSEGSLWIGSGGNGLTRMRDGWFHTISKRDGLNDDIVSQILEDDFGHIWIGTNSGLATFSKRDFEAFAQGVQAAVPITTYGRCDGMPALECCKDLKRPAVKDKLGHLYFATIAGYVRVDPMRLKQTMNRAMTCRARLEEIALDGKRIILPVTNGVDVPPGTYAVTFQWTGCNPGYADKIRFRCRLKGHDRGWIEQNHIRSIRYVNIPPGKYAFEVTACNPSGVWDLKPDSIQLNVEPHFWQTVGFRILGVLMLVLSGAALARWFVNRRMKITVERFKHRHMLLSERARIARDIHDDIGARLTRIALLGSLVEREMPQDVPPSGRKRLSEMTTAVRDVTTALEEVVWAVEPRNDTLDKLATYLCGYSERFLEGTHIRLRLRIPTLLPAITLSSSLRHDVVLAVHEALNNVVCHAHASTVILYLSCDDRFCTIKVEDDGCGMGTERGEGNGLTNMAARMRRQQGSVRYSQRDGGGTVIELGFPIKPGKENNDG